MEKRSLAFLCAMSMTVGLFLFAFTTKPENLSEQAAAIVEQNGSKVQDESETQSEASESQNTQSEVPIAVLEIVETTAEQNAQGESSQTQSISTQAQSEKNQNESLSSQEQSENLPQSESQQVENVLAFEPVPFTLNLNCNAAILIDQATGTVLYEKNADECVAVASITKVMTLLLTFEAIDAGKVSLQDIVPISQHAFSMGGSQIWLEPGEEFKLEELIRAICISSANDAAVAVAEFIGASEPAFVDMMNVRAKELGMQNTTYHNACGLDEEGHVSSAKDVAILSRYIIENHPEVLDYTSIWTDTLRGGETQLTNTNKLLNTYEGVRGLKTGTTGNAGVCLSASATRGDFSIISVVLGSPSSKDRFNATTALLDHGFANYEAAVVPEITNNIETLDVKGGKTEIVSLDYSEVPKTLLLLKGAGTNLKTTASFSEDLKAPIKQGTQIGNVQIFDGEILISEHKITAKEDIEEMTTAYAFNLMWQIVCK